MKTLVDERGIKSDHAEGGTSNLDGYLLFFQDGTRSTKVHDERLIAAIAVAWEMSRLDPEHRTVWVWPSDSRGETFTPHAWYVCQGDLDDGEEDTWSFGFDPEPPIRR